jgi:hypothetical protein
MAGILDNSKSIILDCVLTDTCRYRLATGETAKLKIKKFALADDEINYGRYQKLHPSGSAWHDLEILQTPIFEAFTNNASSMKHRLLTVDRTDLMYMPELLINENYKTVTKMFADANATVTHATSLKNLFLLAADNQTEDKLGKHNFGILFGANPVNSDAVIWVDQGINPPTVNEISPKQSLKSRFPELYESAYSIQMPHHLVRLIDVNTNPVNHSFVDDDQIALYSVREANQTLNLVPGQPVLVTENQNTDDGTVTGDAFATQIHKGPRGSILEFKLLASQDVQSSVYFFTRYGNTMTGLARPDGTGTSDTYYYIDFNIKITGLSTASSIDIPCRLIKFKE